MPQVSPKQRETARKGLQFLLHALSSMGGAQVAEALGVSEATLSRIKNEDLERVVLLIAILDGKVVPAIASCRSPREWSAMVYLAEVGFDTLKREEEPNVGRAPLEFDE